MTLILIYIITIKFTLECSSTSIPYLEVSVRITDNNISISLLTKLTISHLNFDSYRPTNLKKSIFSSQCLRIKRI